MYAALMSTPTQAQPQINTQAIIARAKRAPEDYKTAKKLAENWHKVLTALDAARKEPVEQAKWAAPADDKPPKTTLDQAAEAIAYEYKRAVSHRDQVYGFGVCAGTIVPEAPAQRTMRMSAKRQALFDDIKVGKLNAVPTSKDKKSAIVKRLIKDLTKLGKIKVADSGKIQLLS